MKRLSSKISEFFQDEDVQYGLKEFPNQLKRDFEIISGPIKRLWNYQNDKYNKKLKAETRQKMLASLEPEISDFLENLLKSADYDYEIVTFQEVSGFTVSKEKTTDKDNQQIETKEKQTKTYSNRTKRKANLKPIDFTVTIAGSTVKFYGYQVGLFKVLEHKSGQFIHTHMPEIEAAQAWLESKMVKAEYVASVFDKDKQLYFVFTDEATDNLKQMTRESLRLDLKESKFQVTK